MKMTEIILRSDPRRTAQQAGERAAIIEMLSTCEQACRICADTFLDQTLPAGALGQCVRINLDCAETCATAARLLARQIEPLTAPLHTAQLHACAVACQFCADACGSQAGNDHRFQLCADLCRQCQEQCNLLLIEVASDDAPSSTDDLTGDPP